MNALPRHHTTALAWEWLEHGEGLARSAEEHAHIQATLENIDRVFLEWDAPEDITYPAECIVHWPSGPVYCCRRHGEGLVALGNVMGSHIAMTTLDKPANCVNCVNEGPPE